MVRSGRAGELSAVIGAEGTVHTAATHAAAAHPVLTHAAALAAAKHAAILHANAVAAAAAAAQPQPSFAQQIQTWALDWEPVIAILLFTALIYFMWRMLKVMPKTKPQEIKPASKQRGHAGPTSPASTRPRPSCARSSSSCATRSASRQLGANVPKGILLHGPPGHRQDAARQGRRARVRRAVLQPVRVVVRRDVRRPRRRADPAPVRRGAQATRRRSSSSTSSTPSAARRGTRHLRRARADAQPAARRDGRLRRQRQRRRDGRLQPAREARPGAAAPGPLRPPGLRLAARPERPRRDPRACTRATSRSRRTSTSRWSPSRPAGLTGADLANLCNEAAILAGRNERAVDRPVGLRRRVRAGRRRACSRARVITDHEKRVVAYHEAGHALVGELLPTVDSVAEGLDRPARQGARLHAEPARTRTAT